jgi:hypothetical protein
MHPPTPPAEKKTTQPHLQTKLHPPANKVMRVHMVSGSVAELPSLMCGSGNFQSRSYRNKDYQKVLAQQEKEKKNQYLCPCLERRKDFTPLVYSVDGIAGREAKNVEKRLTYHLLEKWHKQLPQMVYYVQI